MALKVVKVSAVIIADVNDGMEAEMRTHFQRKAMSAFNDGAYPGGWNSGGGNGVVRVFAADASVRPVPADIIDAVNKLEGVIGDNISAILKK